MGTYTVAPVPGRPIVQVTIEGMLTLDDVEHLAKSQTDLASLLRYRPGMFDLLVDVSACLIQPADVAEALNTLSENDGFRPAYLAFIHGDTAVKLQVRRLNAAKAARFFFDRDDALAWLLQQRTPAAVAEPSAKMSDR